MIIILQNVYTVAETIILLSRREKGIIIIGHNSRGRVEGVEEKNI